MGRRWKARPVKLRQYVYFAVHSTVPAIMVESWLSTPDDVVRMT